MGARGEQTAGLTGSKRYVRINQKGRHCKRFGAITRTVIHSEASSSCSEDRRAHARQDFTISCGRKAFGTAFVQMHIEQCNFYVLFRSLFGLLSHHLRHGHTEYPQCIWPIVLHNVNPSLSRMRSVHSDAVRKSRSWLVIVITANRQIATERILIRTPLSSCTSSRV